MKTQFPDDNDEDKIGYGNPPKRSQFKKGQSGNPNGRPKMNKSKSGKDILNELLNTEIRVGDQKMTKRLALFLALLNDAIKGKASARALIFSMIKDEESDLEDFDPSLDDQIEWFKTVSRKSGQLKQENVDGKDGAS